jgi:hypothetical protein
VEPGGAGWSRVEPGGAGWITSWNTAFVGKGILGTNGAERIRRDGKPGSHDGEGDETERDHGEEDDDDKDNDSSV